MKLETPRPNELEPTTLLRQLANVDYLLDVIIPPHERDMRLKFDEFVSDCGTFRCLFGDYLYMKYGEKMLMKFNKSNAGNEIRFMKQQFGTLGSSDMIWDIFGSEAVGTLVQRKCRLITHREHLQTKIAAFTPVSAGSVAA